MILQHFIDNSYAQSKICGLMEVKTTQTDSFMNEITIMGSSTVTDQVEFG